MPGRLPNYSCRACDSTSASLLLSMGEVPMANAFVRPTCADADEYRESLTLVMCDECRLIQIKELVPPEALYRNMPWLSGTSSTSRHYAEWFARRVADRHLREGRRFAVDVASNDGTTLACLRDVGFDVLGVEPSGVADEANRRGIPTVRGLFGPALAERIVAEHGQADLVITRHSLGHADTPVELIRGVKTLMRPEGRFIAEAPYALFLRDELQYDTVFHEHVSYWTFQSLTNFLDGQSLRIVDHSFVPMNGGSFLVEVAHERFSFEPSTRAVLELEEVQALNHARGWELFPGRVQRQRNELNRLLDGIAEEGSKVVGYGAAAKCMTLLNYCGITPDQIRVIGDANPRKQGTLCPGVRIPVVSPEELMAENPDYILIGPSNLRDEIVSSFRDKMGYRNQFILPLPVPRII